MLTRGLCPRYFFCEIHSFSNLNSLKMQAMTAPTFLASLDNFETTLAASLLNYDISLKEPWFSKMRAKYRIL